MDAIFSSVDRCPSLLRMALRNLWLRVADRFQDPEHSVSFPFVSACVWTKGQMCEVGRDQASRNPVFWAGNELPLVCLVPMGMQI